MKLNNTTHVVIYFPIQKLRHFMGQNRTVFLVCSTSMVQRIAAQLHAGLGQTVVRKVELCVVPKSLQGETQMAILEVGASFYFTC
jgi:hypothetical protein